ncbi:MAG: GNAT family N-acetyltransferase [Oligoflexia bacterium]|nr:GNAT family N-acetyltransferase [Oligoflexia bacterium]
MKNKYLLKFKENEAHTIDLPDEYSSRDHANNEEIQIDKIHTPFYPEPIYNNRPFKAKIKFHPPSESQVETLLELPIWRISPLGVELAILENEQHELITYLSYGKSIDLIIYSERDECSFTGVVVSSVIKFNEYKIIGIRWYTSSAHGSHLNLEKRACRRWSCPSEFLPTGMICNPLRFNDFIHFNVEDISLGGMQIVTGLRNKFLLPGMKLEAVISFPLVAQLSICFKIVNVRIVEHQHRSDAAPKQQLALGVTILSRDPQVGAILGQYLYQFCPGVSLTELKEYGLEVSSIAKAVDFTFVRTKEEYLQVLKLRKKSYSAAGKMAEDTPDENAGDIYDTRARIIMGRHHGELVATARLIYCEHDDDYEHSRFVKFPKDFPRKDEVIEVTRVCTDAEYRGGDLFYSLMKQMVLVTLQSNRRYLMSSAVPSLAKLYKRLGAKLTGIHFTHGDLGDSDHELLVLDLHKSLTGEGVNPIVWNLLFSDLTGYLNENNLIAPSPLQNLRMLCYRLLSPCCRFLFKFMNKK